MVNRLIAILALLAIVFGEPLPVNFDSYTQWPGCVRPVPFQEKCVSMWAHVTARMISDRYCVSKKVHYEFSPQSLISCSKASKRCDGFFDVDELTKSVSEQGVLDSNCVKYTGTNETACPSKCDGAGNFTWYKATCKSYNSMPEDLIKGEIMKNGPVACFDDYFKTFDDYNTGIYYNVGLQKYPIKQAFRVVGWGRENGINFWIASAALSDSFGENGNVRLKIKDNFCSTVLVCNP